MEEIVSQIKKNIDNNQTYFVFPSEITAQFWRKNILKLISKKIINRGRFISWDQFKERITGYEGLDPSLKVINNKKRLLFLNRFFVLNRKEKLLKNIIPEKYSSNASAFTKKFLEILPSLYKLKQMNILPHGVHRDKLEDLQCLKRYYRTFLEKNKLYEPNFHPPIFKKLPGIKYFLFFPGVIKDYEVYRSLVTASQAVIVMESEHIRVKKAHNILAVHKNSLHELNHLLENIATLLDRGVEPDQIVITAVNPEEIEEYLKARSLELEIPLYIHRGKSVLSYKEGSFFRNLQNCQGDHFSFQALRSLILNKALPWRAETTIRRLLQFGIKYKCIYDPATKKDPWEKGFKKAGKIGEEDLEKLKRYYKTLKSHTGKIIQSSNFMGLNRNMQGLLKFLFKEEVIRAKQYRVFQFALDILKDFELLDREYGNLAPMEPYSIWLSFLEESQYVKETHSNKIAVYPYRVSAGMYPDYHFIINTSQKGTKTLHSHYPFLNVHEQETLQNPETDLSGTLLALYARSGKQVAFSVSRKSFRDANIFPGYFISHGETKEVPPSPGKTDFDYYKSETRLWLSNGNIRPSALYPAQKEGFLRAEKTLFNKKNRDYTRIEISDEEIKGKILESVKSGELIRISPTWLERYKNCPFNYLLSISMHLEAEAFSPEMLDNRNFGIIMHNIYQKFYEENKNAGDIDRESLEKTVAGCIYGFEQGAPLPVKPYWEYIKEKVQELAEAFIKVEKQEFAGFETVETEKALDFTWEKEGVILFGKVDRISREGQVLAIIDYKKKNAPGKKDIFSEEPSSFQMPFYIYLLEKKLGRKVNVAAYYLMEKKRYIYILAPEKSQKPMASREDLEGAMANIKKEITRYAGNIRQGNFKIPEHIEAKNCRFCSYRSVCRRRYITG